MSTRKYSDVVREASSSSPSSSPSWLRNYQQEDEEEALQRAIQMSKDNLIVLSDDDEPCSRTLSDNGNTAFVMKKKRNRPAEFECWEDESYFPGVPVLPVSSFPYKQRTNTTTKKLKQNKTIDLSRDSPVKRRPSVQVNPDSDSDEMLSKPVFIPRETTTGNRASSPLDDYASDFSDLTYVKKHKKPAAPAGYWEGSPDIPIYEQGRKSGYSAQELAEIIFPDTEDKFRCRKQPLRVRSRKTFLIDLRYLSIEDLYADENGVYKHQATRSRTCLVELDEEKEMEDFKIAECKKIDLSDSEKSYYLVQ